MMYHLVNIVATVYLTARKTGLVSVVNTWTKYAFVVMVYVTNGLRKGSGGYI